MFWDAAARLIGGAACQKYPNAGVPQLPSRCGQPVHYRKARIATSSHPPPISIKALRTRRSKEAESASAPKSDVSRQSGKDPRPGVSKTEVGNASETFFSVITRANPGSVLYKIWKLDVGYSNRRRCSRSKLKSKSTARFASSTRRHVCLVIASWAAQPLAYRADEGALAW